MPGKAPSMNVACAKKLWAISIDVDIVIGNEVKLPVPIQALVSMP